LGGESLLGKYEELKAKYRSVVSERDALARELEKLEARKRLLLEEYEALRARATEVNQLVEERGKLRALLESLGDEKLAKMPAVDESYVREYAERFKGELAEALELFYMGEEAEGVRRVDASNLASLLEVSRSAMDKMRSYMVRMEYELKDIQNEIRRLEDYINDLEDEMAEIEARIGELEHSRSEYDALVTRHGDPVSVAKKIAQLEVDARALQAEEGRLRCARELQEDVLRQLRERGAATCPVCGSSITDAAALPRVEPPEALKLKRERIERMLQDLREVERKLRKLEPELRLLDDYESRRESLSKALDERLEELQELRASAEELEERLREARRRMAELARAYEQLDSYYKRLRYAELQEKLKELEEEIRRRGYDENRLNQLTRELKEVDSRISALKARLDMLEASERQIAGELSALEAAVNSLKDLKKREERVAGLYSNLMAVRSALVEAHVKLRQKLVERLSEIASGIFAELERSGEYDAVEVQVQSAGPRGRRGHYVFRVRRKLDGSYVPALTRMSDGQRGLLALSLLLALRQLKPRSFAVLILDDPVPNVDEDTKVAIAKLLAEKMPAGLQVIFTTQSRRVAEELSPTAKVVAAGAAKS
jgi:DNA repair exonuclease SbcCD ATPase subunit